MAVTTYTASSQTATPKAVHVGMNVARGTFTLNAAASTTASDVILLVKIPNGAYIVDGFITGTHDADTTAASVKVGTTADDDCALTTSSLSSTTARTNFNGAVLPFKVSLSDDAEPKWTWLKATIIEADSYTTTMSIQCVVYYSMDLDI